MSSLSVTSGSKSHSRPDMNPCSQVNGNGIQARCLAWGEGFGGPWGGLPDWDVPSSPTYSQHSCYCGLQGPCCPFSSSRTKQGKRAMNQDLPRGAPDTTRQKREAWACHSKALFRVSFWPLGLPDLSTSWVPLQTTPLHSWQPECEHPSISAAPRQWG